MIYGVFLFNTTTAAVQAQKVLNTKGYNATLIPAPKAIQQRQRHGDPLQLDGTGGSFRKC